MFYQIRKDQAAVTIMGVRKAPPAALNLRPSSGKSTKKRPRSLETDRNAANVCSYHMPVSSERNMGQIVC